MVALLVLAGLGEGVGVLALLPVLELATGVSGTDGSAIASAFVDILGRLSLEPTLGVLVLIIVLAIGLKGLFLWLAMREVGYTVAQVTTDLRMRLLRALLHSRWRHFASLPTGRLANAVSSEAHRASAAYMQACHIFSGLIHVMMYLVVAVLISWQVAIVALVGGIGLMYVLRGLVNMTRSAGRSQTELLRSLIARLTDSLRGIKAIKAMGRERHLWPLLERETQGLNEALQRQVLAMENMRLFQEPLAVALLGAGLFVLLTYGSQPFSSVLVMAVIFYRLIGHTNLLQTRYQQMTLGESAYWSIRDQIELAEGDLESRSGHERPPELRVSIDLDSVSFSYGDGDILRDVSLTIPAGRLVAISGPSGSGKTTVADLIVGLHRPDRGEVYVDGVPLSSIDLLAWRGMIGYVPQEVLLFHDTILRNVTLGDDSIELSRVEEALRAADAWGFVSSRPDGVHSIVGEQGVMFSGGQRQRIAIARALVGEPRLLVLDEVTTALDPLTEQAICDTLRKLRGSVTIISISHQPAMLEAADLIYHLEHGRVVRSARASVTRQPASASD